MKTREPKPPRRPKRIQILLPRAEVLAIDTWRRKVGIDSRAAAIRQLANERLKQVERLVEADSR